MYTWRRICKYLPAALHTCLLPSDSVVGDMGLVFYLLVAVVVLLVLFFMALLHAGYFYDLRIRTSSPLSLPGRVAYKLYRGSYTNAGAAFKELALFAPHLRTFGIYYDDPKRVSLVLGIL